MQPYKMATNAIKKQPFKVIEIPLTKFSEEVIPHHQIVFETYKTAMHKLISAKNVEHLSKEINDKKIVIKQLRDLMYELDTLRTQVEDTDLDKFDIKTLSLRKILLRLISGYLELEKTALKIIQPPPTTSSGDADKENLQPEHLEEGLRQTMKHSPFRDADHIRIEGTIEGLKLKNAENTYNEVENLQQDVQDLHEIYKELNLMVDVQGDSVRHVEEVVEESANNVQRGASFIEKAHKMKAVAYPVSGAVLGGLIGGPLGLIAGVKVGGIAALGCAVMGYTGGKFLEKTSETDAIEHETVCNENTENEQTQSESVKKDI